nr:farnesyl diphosphate synthase [Desulfocicer vacuolatum]
MNPDAFDLSEYLAKKRNLLDSTLLKILSMQSAELELTRAVSHSLMAGGKRLRPVLCMAAAQALGGDYHLALPPACAIEMIHTYSLIHDDLPAMDDDDLRRGVPTCHKAFSEATAVLAGDALLTHAFTVLAHPAPYFNIVPNNATLLELVFMISRAAGVNGMVEGQMMDMLAPDMDMPRENALNYLKKLHWLKTGQMIKVSVQAGAVAVGGSREMVDQLGRYSEKIGLAFQVVDDILNVEGDPAVMGKATGSDAEHEKLTFPALLGLEPSRKFAKELVADAKDSLISFGEKARPLMAIADYIITRKR